MANTNKILKEDYLYRLIPDLGYINYYEKLYWSKTNRHQLYDDNDLYTIIFNLNGKININSYRAVIVSDIPLKCVEKYDQIWEELEPYSGRYVYVSIASDIDQYRESIECVVADSSNIPEDAYIFVLRF